MDVTRYVVDAVVLEGRSRREVARDHGISKSWVAELVSRFRAGGYEALEARSKAPHSIPSRTRDETEDRIVALRKELSDKGFDAGAHTIHYHLGLSEDELPSVATIWRVLVRGGASSHRSRTSVREALTSASRLRYPTSAGRQTSPSGS